MVLVVAGVVTDLCAVVFVAAFVDFKSVKGRFGILTPLQGPHSVFLFFLQ